MISTLEEPIGISEEPIGISEEPIGVSEEPIGVSNDTQRTEPDERDREERVLDRVVRCWKHYQRSGLVVRHKIGRILNDLLGPPTKRLPQGERVMKKVAKRLGKSESEVSRFRGFADNFADVPDLLKAYPECNTWTKFKALLPKLKLSQGGEAMNLACCDKSVVHHAILRSVKKLREKIRSLESVQASELNSELREELQGLAMQVSNLLR